MEAARQWAIGALLVLAACVLAACGSGSSSTASSTTAAAGSTAAPAKPATKEVVVPKLVGESFGQAVQDVKRVGLNQEAPRFPGTVGNRLYPTQCFKVLNQAPAAGTKLPKGATVSIVFGGCHQTRPANGGS